MDFPFRKDVKAFRFTDFSFDGETSTAFLRYAFDDSAAFEETVTFCDAPALTDERRDALQKCLRLLHLAAGVSYYKAYVPAEIRVETSPLSNAEAEFFDLFYRSGLGEFSYRNGIVPHIGFPFSETAVCVPSTLKLASRVVVPVGGGKDSVVTLEALKAAGKNPIPFSVGAPRPIKETIELSGLPSIKKTACGKPISTY